MPCLATPSGQPLHQILAHLFKEFIYGVVLTSADAGEPDGEQAARTTADARAPRGRVVTVANFADECGLQTLPQILNVNADAALTTCCSVHVLNGTTRFSGQRPVVRANRDLFGRPHYRWQR